MNDKVEAISDDMQYRDEMSRRVWEKPQAKVAEVAQATLNGNTTFNLSDLGTCAS